MENFDQFGGFDAAGDNELNLFTPSVAHNFNWDIPSDIVASIDNSGGSGGGNNNNNFSASSAPGPQSVTPDANIDPRLFPPSGAAEAGGGPEMYPVYQLTGYSNTPQTNAPPMQYIHDRRYAIPLPEAMSRSHLPFTFTGPPIAVPSLTRNSQPSVPPADIGALPFSGGLALPGLPAQAAALPAQLALRSSAPETRAPVSRVPSPVRPAKTAPSRAPTPALPRLPSRAPTPALPRLPSLSVDGDDDEETFEALPPQRGKGKIRELDFSKVYPATQMPQTPAKFLDKFAYNRQGEWLGHLSFTWQDIRSYMTERKASGLPLRIWVQNMPAGCTKRGGPDQRTRKCRWDRCVAKNHTILKGFWRVAFDERPSTSGKTTDPFTNAGYMHLYCFEKAFDLIGLIVNGTCDIRPDIRKNFRQEDRNPMSLVRDHWELMEAYEDWTKQQVPKYQEWQAILHNRYQNGVEGNSSRRHRTRDDYLWARLTDTHLSMESSARQSTRDARNGISIDKHRGDLSLYTQLTERRRVTNKTLKEEFEAWNKTKPSRNPPETPLRRSPRTQKAPRKRAREDEADDDEEDFQLEPAPKRSRIVETRIDTTNSRYLARNRGSSPSTPTPTRRSPRLQRKQQQLLEDNAPADQEQQPRRSSAASCISVHSLSESSVSPKTQRSAKQANEKETGATQRRRSSAQTSTSEQRRSSRIAKQQQSGASKPTSPAIEEEVTATAAESELFPEFFDFDDGSSLFGDEIQASGDFPTE